MKSIQLQKTGQDEMKKDKPLQDKKRGKVMDAVAGVLGLPHVSSNK
jgi:hypothetical protein